MLAVLTCMDPRLDPLAMLGLELGEAAVLRNAGARATDEQLAALALGRDRLGVDRIAVVIHTDCRAEPDPVSQESSLHADVERLRQELGVTVEAFRYDVDAGTLTAINPAG